MGCWRSNTPLFSFFAGWGDSRGCIARKEKQGENPRRGSRRGPARRARFPASADKEPANTPSKRSLSPLEITQPSRFPPPSSNNPLPRNLPPPLEGRKVYFRAISKHRCGGKKKPTITQRGRVTCITKGFRSNSFPPPPESLSCPLGGIFPLSLKSTSEREASEVWRLSSPTFEWGRLHWRERIRGLGRGGRSPSMLPYSPPRGKTSKKKPSLDGASASSRKQRKGTLEELRLEGKGSGVSGVGRGVKY